MAPAPTTGEASRPAPADGKVWPRLGRPARAALRSAGTILRPACTALRSARTALRPAGPPRPRRRIRLIDVLRVLGLARRAVPRPVVGPKAYPQWWQRLLALVVLILLVAGIGFALAALVGLLVVVAGFLLEQAIS